MGLKQIPKGPLKEGFTTGTAATAACKAALMALLTKQKYKQVTVHLPIDEKRTIAVAHVEIGENNAKAGIVKDAGDDPDVTNGALVECSLRFCDEPGVFFHRGKGVGVVTLPGLSLAVGEPAINPVPRKMMTNAIQKILHDFAVQKGVEVTISIENGVQLAKRTLNERVGIRFGLSILGTSGIVKPYSAASYIASIEQGIDVAQANGIDALILNSGARSEKYMRSLYPNAGEQAFIHYGNWIGATLTYLVASKISKVSIGIMLGKAVKLAKGITDTHSCISAWDKEFIMQIADKSGYPPAQIESIKTLNMAGRLTELFTFDEKEAFFHHLMKKCYTVISKIIPAIQVQLYLINKDGTILKYHTK